MATVDTGATSAEPTNDSKEISARLHELVTRLDEIHADLVQLSRIESALYVYLAKNNAALGRLNDSIDQLSSAVTYTKL